MTVSIIIVVFLIVITCAYYGERQYKIKMNKRKKEFYEFKNKRNI